MRKVVGIDRKIKRAWIDALLDRLARAADESELRAFLDQYLKEELPGKESRAKTVGILLRIWAGPSGDRGVLRDRAVSLLTRIGGQERIWLHWGMTCLAYPFFRDTAEVVGRLLALQDDFTTAQVQGRMMTTWGDRVTSQEAAQKLLTTLVDWEVLRSTKTKGHFLLTRRTAASVPDVQLWLLDALLAASDADEIEAQQLLRLPESFPFSISLGVADLRRYEGFDIHRQGLDMDMVARRRVKPQPTPKERRKPAKKPKQTAPTLFEEPQPLKVSTQSVLQGKPVESLQPTTIVEPEPSSKPLVAEAIAPAESVHRSGQSRAAPVREERLMAVGVPELSDETPFQAAIAESVRLYHEGMDFACIALSDGTIDAIVRLICRVRLGARQSKCADVRSQFGALAALGVLPTPLKTRLEKLWYERVDYLALNPVLDLDRSALERVSLNHVQVLLDLLHQFLGHTTDHGEVVPEHAEYWNLGGNKLPPKARTLG